jgi:hypothetical protein
MLNSDIAATNEVYAVGHLPKSKAKSAPQVRTDPPSGERYDCAAWVGS